MKYTSKSFTVPVGSAKVTDEAWDRAFLSPEEYRIKYPLITIRVEPACAQDKAPAGWWCTRDQGHDGPCAAVPIHQVVHFAQWGK